jgi:type II secretory pathway pseudopilin PulG
MLKTRKSFTLIELLVIIAIIGILSAVVITAVNSARQKAKVSAGKGKMSSIPAVLATCISAKGSINDPKVSPAPNPNYICDVQSATDIVWPDLSQDGWEWLSITGKDSNNVTVSARCEAKNCGTYQYALITVNGVTFYSNPPPTASVTFTPIENTVTTANAYFTAASPDPFAIIWTISGQEITTSGTTIGLATCTRSGSSPTASTVSCSTFKPDVAKFNHTIQANVVGGNTRTWHWILNSPTPTPTIIAPTPTPSAPEE